MNTEATIDQSRILKNLVKYHLTTEDLANTIGRSQSVTQDIVQSLWEKGYIDYLNAPMIFILFPDLRNNGYRQTQVPADAFITTTSKGYFHLYPPLQRLM